MQDLFTTLVDAQWRWTLMVFSMSFMLSWTTFALIWWLISYTHGDLDALEEQVIDNSSEPMKPCITNINGFMSCFLFSVETQHTIGYGNRYINEECPAAIFTMCLQSIMGVFIQVRIGWRYNMKWSLQFTLSGIYGGNRLCEVIEAEEEGTNVVVLSVRCDLSSGWSSMLDVPSGRYAKKSYYRSPREGTNYKKEGELTILRIPVIINTKLLQLPFQVTRENELIPFHQEELAVGTDGKDERLMFIWPTTIVHRIDKHSPLYSLTAQDLLKERFEIVVMLGEFPETNVWVL